MIGTSGTMWVMGDDYRGSKIQMRAVSTSMCPPRGGWQYYDWQGTGEWESELEIFLECVGEKRRIGILGGREGDSLN